MACFGRGRRRRAATRVASRIPDIPAIRATNGPVPPPASSEAATVTGLISCGSAPGVASTGGLGEPTGAAAGGTGEVDGAAEGLADADAEGAADALADGEGFFAAAAEADGFAAATGAATGAGGGAAGAGGGGAGGGASLPPSHPAPGADWLPATWGDTGGVDEEGDEFPPNSTVAKMYGYLPPDGLHAIAMPVWVKAGSRMFLRWGALFIQKLCAQAPVSVVSCHARFCAPDR